MEESKPKRDRAAYLREYRARKRAEDPEWDAERKRKANEYMKRHYRESAEYREATKARAKAAEEKLKVDDPEEYLRRRREYAARHRAKNPEATAARQLQYNQQAREKAREFVIALKTSTPCADCGGFFHHVAMDFDHVRGKKFKAVAQMVGAAYPVANIAKEVAKCDLVCANCHRIRTWTRLKREGIDMEEAL